MRSALICLGFFLISYIFSSSIGISTIGGHLGLIALSLFSLKHLYKYYLFWFLLLTTLVLSSEARFSVEYFLYASSLFAFAKSKFWLENKNKKHILLALFILLIVANHLKITLYERGSLLLWLPVYISLYYSSIRKDNFMVYVFSTLALALSNKLTSLIALFTTVRSKLLYFTGLITLGLVFLFRQNIFHFIEVSILPRLYIWDSSFVGFLNKPLWGHGFGTFALDFSVYRAHAPVLGARIDEQIIHGHSTLFNSIFELGILGLFLILALLYLVAKNSPRALAPLIVILLLDSSLAKFNQFFLAGLIIIPFIKDFGQLDYLKARLPSKSHLSSKITAYALSLVVFIPSLLGHYYYDMRNYDKAIKWDPLNSLYHFTRGATGISTDLKAAEKDIENAISLSPSVSYFYGFLASTQLGLNKINEANETINKAIKFDGDDGYWQLIKALANHKDKELFKKHYQKAVKRNPEIETLINQEGYSSAQYIGSTKSSDVRLSSFYRQGPNLYFPLPIIDKKEIQKLLN